MVAMSLCPGGRRQGECWIWTVFSGHQTGYQPSQKRYPLGKTISLDLLLKSAVLPLFFSTKYGRLGQSPALFKGWPRST